MIKFTIPKNTVEILNSKFGEGYAKTVINELKESVLLNFRKDNIEKTYVLTAWDGSQLIFVLGFYKFEPVDQSADEYEHKLNYYLKSYKNG